MAIKFCSRSKAQLERSFLDHRDSIAKTLHGSWPELHAVTKGIYSYR